MTNKNQHIDTDLLTRFFADEVSSEERKRILDWKDASPENNIQFEELKRVWLSVDKIISSDEINISAEWQYLQSRLNITGINKLKISPALYILRIAAAIFIGFGLFYISRVLLTEKTVASNYSETKEIILPDGSKVTLNASSQLSFKRHFGKDQRMVKLKGEAFFEVVKNSEWPFIIQVDQTEIKVIGTSFNVKSSKNGSTVEVTVAEGLVSVYSKNKKEYKVLAAKGEKAIFLKKENTVKKLINEDSNYLSWKTKSIVFNNENLLNVASTLSNVYHKDIILKNPVLENCTITTRFENNDFATVLKVLQSTLDIHISETEKQVIITGNGC